MFRLFVVGLVVSWVGCWVAIMLVWCLVVFDCCLFTCLLNLGFELICFVLVCVGCV